MMPDSRLARGDPFGHLVGELRVVGGFGGIGAAVDDLPSLLLQAEPETLLEPEPAVIGPDGDDAPGRWRARSRGGGSGDGGAGLDRSRRGCTTGDGRDDLAHQGANLLFRWQRAGTHESIIPRRRSTRRWRPSLSAATGTGHGRRRRTHLGSRTPRRKRSTPGTAAATASEDSLPRPKSHRIPGGRVSLREAQHQFGVSSSTIAAWARSGKVDAVKDDGRWMVTPASVAAHLSEHHGDAPRTRRTDPGGSRTPWDDDAGAPGCLGQTARPVGQLARGRSDAGRCAGTGRQGRDRGHLPARAALRDPRRAGRTHVPLRWTRPATGTAAPGSGADCAVRSAPKRRPVRTRPPPQPTGGTSVTPMPSIVTTRGLRFAYGDIVALSGVDLDVPAGRIGLVGANGAGKTTLIKLLLGILPPAAGDITVLGRSIPGQMLEVRSRVGFMPEGDVPATRPDGGRLPHLRRRTGRASAAGGPAAGQRRPDHRRPPRRAVPPTRGVQHRDAAARQVGPGDRPRPRTGPARRTHRRPRPGGPRGDARPGHPTRRLRHQCHRVVPRPARHRAHLLVGGHARRGQGAAVRSAHRSRRSPTTSNSRCWATPPRSRPHWWQPGPR